MNKLILLISLIGFISINAFAQAPRRVNQTKSNGFGVGGFPQSTVAPNSQTVQVPCKASSPNCIERNTPQRQTASRPVTGEEKIKQDCHRSTGGYGDAYQRCLRSNGIVRVNRNINSDDASQTDARVCNRANPVCRECIDRYASGDSQTFRTKVTECINAKQAATSRPNSTPRRTEERRTETAAASCPPGTTAQSGTNMCKCDGENVTVRRGTSEVCASSCKAEEHREYSVMQKSCVCSAGYIDPSGRGTGACQARRTPTPNVEACLQELQAKVDACGTAADVAVDRCDPKRKEGGDSIDALQELLQGGSSLVGGAAANCGRAAIAGTTGYYAVEAVRNKCDDDVSSCKTSCSDSESFINANKEKAYEKCRQKAFEDDSCLANPQYGELATIGRESEFYAAWDQNNRALFDQKIQEMLTQVSTENAKCETSGTALANRDKMTDFMDDMDSAFKSAAQCECQLGSNNANCANQVGPKDCAADPTLAGCATAKINCLDSTNNSPQCICFRNPTSDACLDVANLPMIPQNGSNVSGFAGGTAAKPVAAINGAGGGGASQNAGGKIDPGDLTGLKEDSEIVPLGSTSGTATGAADGAPFGSAQSIGGASGGGSGGGAGAGDDLNAAAGEGEGGIGSGIKSFFNTAKSGLSNMFNKKGSGSNNEATTSYGRGSGAGGLGQDGVDTKRWRPRGALRGLASGADSEDQVMAGKFEDIWKVMNRQYKVQDQKDKFIFGEKN